MDSKYIGKLEGTERQIAWAEKLREEFIESAESKINTYLERSRNLPDSRENKAELIAKYELADLILKTCTKNRTKATWWIDRRDRGGFSVVMDLTEEKIVKDKANL